MVQVSGRRVRQFRRDAKGSVAILFGLALIPILLGVGVAIDYGRALIVRERLADAADSAALAIGSWPGLNQAELKQKAQQFFNANYPVSAIGTPSALDVVLDGDNIKIGVTAEVPTTFMKLANVSKLDVGVEILVTKKQRNIELALVLDTTGSMKGAKLTAMKNAAKKMVETLFEGKNTSDTLRVAVVPYSGAVNIGSDKLNSGWLDKATYSASNESKSPIAFEDLDKTNGTSVLGLYQKIGKSWSGCVRERGGSYQLTDDAPKSGTPASLWVPYFAPDEPSKLSNKKCAANTTYANEYICETLDTSTNCVLSVSSSNKEANQRQCNTAKYKSSALKGSGGPDYNCPPAKVTALTNTKNTVISAIDALVAEGNTVIPAGLLWGWRVLSPTEPFTEGAPYDDEKWVKALVLLTDGENMVSGGSNGFNKSVYNAFGYAKNGHLGNTSGSQAESNLNDKTKTVCEAIKNSGSEESKILVYTIGFQVDDTTTNNLLKNCATKPDMYYNSPTNEQLSLVFSDIAQGLSELRIAQ